MAASNQSLWDNPLGTDGFEFVEYAAPDPAALGVLFEQMGFSAIAKHRSKNVLLYRQGEINFIVNAEKDSFAQGFARVHGPSICAMARSRSRTPPTPITRRSRRAYPGTRKTRGGSRSSAYCSMAHRPRMKCC